MCRASYIHGSTRAFILEVPEDRVGDIILAIHDDVTFETLDEIGTYTLGQPVVYKEAEGKASRMSTIWKGRIKVPAGFSHDTEILTSQVTGYFNKCGLDVTMLAVLRDTEFGIATPDYAIEFSPQDVSGWVDVAYLTMLRAFEIKGHTQKVNCSFEPYKEIATHWQVCRFCLGIPDRSCICHQKNKPKVNVAGASTSTGTRAEAKANRMEALKRKAREAATAKAKAARTDMRTD